MRTCSSIRTNDGPSTATDIATSLSIPKHVTIAAARGATRSGALVYWDRPSLAANATVTYTVTFKVQARAHTKTKIRCATASFKVDDPDPADNVAATTIKFG